MTLDPALLDEIRLALCDYVVSHYGSLGAAAKAWGVSSPFASNVLAGRKSPTPAILADAGLCLKLCKVTR